MSMDFQVVAYQYKHTSITVEQARGRGDVVRWAVRDGSSCFTKDGYWEIEPKPSSRDDAFIARARYDDIDAAFEAARQGYANRNSAGGVTSFQTIDEFLSEKT